MYSKFGLSGLLLRTKTLSSAVLVMDFHEVFI